ncbi:MAG TPA: trans-aconitate 2-methyltransferase [Mycobacteriales bacterium]
MWDPHQYEIYADQRGRPFDELVARIGAPSPARVVDLGCGTGAFTARLLDRWPEATVVGVDSSAQMLTRAAQHARPPRLTFHLGDIAAWVPDRPVNVITSNAALQWVPGHADLLPAFVRALTDDGWLAFQVPGNFDSPTHTLLADLRRSAAWRDSLSDPPRPEPAVLTPEEYLDRLSGLGCAVDVWETTYQQVLPGADPVLEWMRGTGLRPTLEVLDPADAERFTDQYAALLREAYPAREYGTVLPYRRIFVVAHR